RASTAIAARPSRCPPGSPPAAWSRSWRSRSSPWTASRSTPPPSGVSRKRTGPDRGCYDGPPMAVSLTVDEAFAHCEARVRRHYENFPVGRWVPKEKRPYVHALYAFARAADDFADEAIYE